MTNSKGPMLNRMKKFDNKFRKKDTKLNEIDLKKYIDKIYLTKHNYAFRFSEHE